MEANKADALRCLEIAESYILKDEKVKAMKLLTKSLRMYPTEKAKGLLDRIMFTSSTADNINGNTPASSATDSSLPEKNENSKPETSENRKKSTRKHVYSEEQLEAVKKIKKCKDFYEILGVSRNATDSELKRSYRKLALQFHPDKNKAPGATEAFKAVGKAFSVLSDKTKRAQYDAYGSEGDVRNSSEHFTAYPRTFYAWADDDDFSAEELFNIFFGSYTGEPFLHRRSAHCNYHDNNRHARTLNSNFNLLFQLFPALIVIMFTVLSTLFVTDPPYSFQRNSKYNVQRFTPRLRIEYFTPSDIDMSSLPTLEMNVEKDFQYNLYQECIRERRALINYARMMGSQADVKNAFSEGTPSCNRYSSIFNPR